MDLFKVRLFELRKEKGLTQDELCDILLKKYDYKTTKSMISKYEAGLHEPNFYFIDIASDLFGVSPDYLIGRSDLKHGKIETKKIPLLGKIAAGIPIDIQEDIQGYECVEINDETAFALTVKGDSMINARIFDGDVVYIKQQPVIENGQIAAVMIDDNVTLKRVFYDGKRIILHSENPTIPDMIYNKGDIKNIQIIGKAIKCKFGIK